MTAPAAEAAAGASEAGAGASRSGTAPPPVKKVANRPPRAPGMGPSKSGTAPPRPRARRGRQGPAGRQGTPGEPGRQEAAQRRESGQRREGGQQRKGGSKPKVTLGKGDVTSYQAVILAEFVAAILLVAATPFAKKDQPGVSPYVGADLLQLVALTVTYFVLALISGANRGAGRFAAWFGALILLTVGLAEAARLAKLLNVFGLSSPPGPAADSTGTGQAPGTTTAGGRGG